MSHIIFCRCGSMFIMPWQFFICILKSFITKFFRGSRRLSWFVTSYFWSSRPSSMVLVSFHFGGWVVAKGLFKVQRFSWSWWISICYWWSVNGEIFFYWLFYCSFQVFPIFLRFLWWLNVLGVDSFFGEKVDFFTASVSFSVFLEFVSEIILSSPFWVPLFHKF